MSGFGGFGGFGNSNPQNSSFGGFGSNNNTNPGFGSGAFGSTGGGLFGNSNTNANTGGGLFGGNTNTNTGSGFGGFGNNAPKTTFGASPFATSTSNAPLFGGGATSTAGGGMFGGATANNQTTGGFGTNTGGGLFGQQQNKPAAFGATNTNTTGGGLFGASNTTGGFGQSTGTTQPAFGGFGGASAGREPNNGTASTPFEAVIEKDGTSGTQHFQTITFQPKYMPYSLEELRLVDYAQGRRYGNQNGQAGAFGQSSGFGGTFGNTNTQTNTAGNTQGGGLFGNANTNTTGGFGATNNATTGGLFGQAKPATGGLFGTTATTTQPSGGLFGTAGTTNTTGGFGSNATGSFGSTNTGGGLFGQQNQTQNKPAFGGFGTTATTGTTGGFGSTPTPAFGQQNQASTGGGLFGSTTTGSGFGGAQQQQNTTGGGLFGGGAFGQQNQQQPQQNQTQNQGGGLFGGFGNANTQQQAKPGLFGASTTANTGTSLFGGQQNTQPQQQTGGGLFGNTTQQPQQQGSSLFGAKPAATGSLFGGNTNTANTGGGLFGNLNTNQNQQNQGSSLGGGLFGQQNQQQQKPSLFGSTTGTNTGGGLFGGQNNAAQGSLFGGSQQQQPQQPLNNSLLGTSQQSNALHTSLGQNPYGNSELFMTTPGGSQQNPGPVATPLSSTLRVKKAAPLPQHKLNPAASTRLITPQKRTGTFGFSYSTYGTPGSAYSSPAFGNSLLSSQRSLGKSMSTSNLRNAYNPQDSILTPGAFSRAGPDFVGSGSLKRLQINRTMANRPSLFGNEQATASPVPKKSVSFDQTANGAHANGLANGLANGATPNGTRNALVRTEVDEPASQPEPVTRGASVRDVSRPPMEQISGNELAVVPEHSASNSTSKKDRARATQKDQDLGAYWSKPSIEELLKMPSLRLRAVPDFIVGRDGVGTIHFLRPVDLTTVDLNNFFGTVINLITREASVYGPTSNVDKALPGLGLNVHSRISLENSWPRTRAGRLPVHEKKGPRVDKHIERLKDIKNTKFIDFKIDTGEWTFEVEHFSTYGLPDDDDESYWDEDETELSAAPDTPTQVRTPGAQATPSSAVSQEDISMADSSPDDTFDFKKGKRASLPGGFGEETIYDDEDGVDEGAESFLDDGSVGSLDGGQDEDMTDKSGSELAEDLNMAGSFSGPVQTTEQSAATEPTPLMGSIKPKSILKASQAAPSGMGTPAKTKFIFEDDWAEQLQRTVSPKKQNRQALKENQGTALKEFSDNIPRMGQSFNAAKPITNHIDLMNSLFGQETSKVGGAKRDGTAEGLQYPYSKRPKTSHNLGDMAEIDQQFHSCNKPRWSLDGTLVYAASGNALSLDGGILAKAKQPIVSEHKDIQFAKLATHRDATCETLVPQKDVTQIILDHGIPQASVSGNFQFGTLAQLVAIDTEEGRHEQQAWQLASILFDDVDLPAKLTPGLTKEDHIHRARKAKLSEFWQSLVFDDAQMEVQEAETAEGKALAHLTAHNVVDACQTLVGGKDFRLATMVAQIGGGLQMRKDMQAQLEEWQRMDVVSEMEEPLRAIYELLAGNCTKSDGDQAQGIQGGLENKASTFSISSHFRLDWRRAFGLRLWYGTLAEEPLHLAVTQFAYDLREGREDVKPIPWFVEDALNMGWNDPTPESREDLLWGLLKLYSASYEKGIPANVEDIFSPQSTTGNPMNARLPFQLSQLFQARVVAAPPTLRISQLPVSRSETGYSKSFMSSTSSAPGGDQAPDPFAELSDNIALTYASTLHTKEHWLKAVYVYTHLSSPANREHYIRSVMSFFSSSFTTLDTDPTYITLTKDLHIPKAWLHSAKALQAKSDGDSTTECRELLGAGDLVTAHEVLCRAVAPAAIIARDYDTLRELLGDFDSPPNSPANPTANLRSSIRRGASASSLKSEAVPGWRTGGLIYFDYIHLLDLEKSKHSEAVHKEAVGIVARLSGALEPIAGQDFEGRNLEERVALGEIAGAVANWGTNERGSKARVLRLPLTEDKWLRHSRELSMGYYKAVLAAAR
ncbi:uncharacterized protein BDZ99DRAFT_569010 [Mytilinidion resinicola]|uniref:Peptidase S59 domain-containing protein n=1 Tax=Mytilinidion resinicola TaxID=574789 RepID=A0A6A6YWE3_9PEZI|nr:uncharacterized protein BDZ99DRAFT_569010 [Mytilinidion resinicola]KAF2812314.1 hypothetical protein BDZ99DRAFT_569010 [Mytilinidion resinicola]